MPPAKCGRSFKVAPSAATITSASSAYRNAHWPLLRRLQLLELECSPDSLENLDSLIVHLTPHSGIRDVAERRKINSWDKRAARSGQDDNLVRAILLDAIESVDKVRVILSRKG
jgi:hypothetical protein